MSMDYYGLFDGLVSIVSAIVVSISATTVETPTLQPIPIEVQVEYKEIPSCTTTVVEWSKECAKEQSKEVEVENKSSIS